MIGFFTTVGPNEGDICVDAVHAVLMHYKSAKLWIRDDATEDGTYTKLEALALAHPDRIDLARNPTSMGLAGIAVSVFRTLDRICRAPERLEMLIQFDPDVWLRDGLDVFARNKFAEHGPGILGSYTRSPSGAKRSHRVHRNSMLRDCLPFGRDRASGRQRLGFPFYFKHLFTAFRHGYRPGRHVLAAFYVLHSDTLYALGRAGFWASMPETGSRSIKEDDPLISLGAYVVGHKLIDIHDAGQPQVWIQHQAPLPFGAARILAEHYLAVHPLKQDRSSLTIRSQLQQELPKLSKF